MDKLKKISIDFLMGVLSVIKSQNFWEKIYTIALKQMNYGNGGDVRSSGEKAVIERIYNQFSRKNDKIILFDVGANKGLYSNALNEVFGESAEIHAFEPSRSTYEILKSNVINIKNIKINNFGLSDVEQNHLLFKDFEGSGLASIYHRNLEHHGIEFEKTEEIQLKTIDSYCNTYNLQYIHFLKLDIEGHELSALNGAKNMINAGKIGFIQFEFGGCNIDSRTFFQDFFYLLKDQYDIYRICSKGLYKIENYKESYEIFQAINFLAVNKEINIK